MTDIVALVIAGVGLIAILGLHVLVAGNLLFQLGKGLAAALEEPAIWLVLVFLVTPFATFLVAAQSGRSNSWAPGVVVRQCLACVLVRSAR